MSITGQNWSQARNRSLPCGQQALTSLATPRKQRQEARMRNQSCGLYLQTWMWGAGILTAGEHVHFKNTCNYIAVITNYLPGYTSQSVIHKVYSMYANSVIFSKCFKTLVNRCFSWTRKFHQINQTFFLKISWGLKSCHISQDTLTLPKIMIYFKTDVLPFESIVS